ncbi:MAG: outer membrane protein beta-barrel domain [Bacteroidota bacterium]
MRPYVSQSQFRSALSTHGEGAAVSNALSLAATVGNSQMKRDITTSLVVLLVFTGQTFAQSPASSDSKGELKRIEIGVNISPDYADRILRKNGESTTADWIIDGRNERETAKLGMTAGISFGYRFTKSIGIETGISYSNKGYQTKKDELTFGQMIDPRYGFTYSTSNGGATPTHVRFIYNHHYIGIPVKVNFWVGGDKWKFVSSIGVVTEFLVKSTNTAVLFMSDDSKERNTQESNDDYKLINLSPTVSAGVEYALNPTMSLRVEPTFRFGVLQIIDTPVTAYLYSTGLQFGYYFKL